MAQIQAANPISRALFHTAYNYKRAAIQAGDLRCLTALLLPMVQLRLLLVPLLLCWWMALLGMVFI